MQKMWLMKSQFVPSQSSWEEGQAGYWAGHHPAQWLLLQAACSIAHHFGWSALSPIILTLDLMLIS